MILRVQVNEIASYNEDVVFLVVPDESEFSCCVPIVIGTCTLGRIINVIKESEMERLSTPWTMVRVFCLPSRQGTVVEDLGAAGEGPVEEGATALESPTGWDLDKPVFMKENVRLGPFQTQILECKVTPLIGESAQVMVMPLKVGESQPGGAWPLPLRLHVLHTFTRLKMSSSKMSVVVQNTSESPIFLNKGVQLAWVVSASPVLPMEFPSKMEATLSAHVRLYPWQEKLLEKLNLDGLSHWTPQNAAAAEDLILAFHDIFALEGNKLGCTSTIEHEICITDSKPFKERFRHIPPLLLEEMQASP